MKNKSKYLGNEELYVNKVLNSEKWSSTEGSWTGSRQLSSDSVVIGLLVSAIDHHIGKRFYRTK